MQRAWVIVLAACGFRSSPAIDDASAPAADGMPDVSSPDVAPASCWEIMDSSINFQISVCPTMLVDAIDVTSDTPIDTDSNTVPASGLGCAPLSPSSASVCAL